MLRKLLIFANNTSIKKLCGNKFVKHISSTIYDRHTLESPVRISESLLFCKNWFYKHLSFLPKLITMKARNHNITFLSITHFDS